MAIYSATVQLFNASKEDVQILETALNKEKFQRIVGKQHTIESSVKHTTIFSIEDNSGIISLSSKLHAITKKIGKKYSFTLVKQKKQYVTVEKIA